MLGKPVIRGTRVTVELILEKLAAGETMEMLLEAHPRLTAEDIRAALGYGAAALRSEIIGRHGQELTGVFAVASPGVFRIRRPPL